MKPLPPAPKIPKDFNKPLAQSTVSIGKVSSQSMGKVSPRTRAKLKLEAKKHGENGCQELEFGNLKQAAYCFEKALDILKNIC